MIPDVKTRNLSYTTGEFEVEVFVTNDDGPSVRAKFMVNVGTHFDMLNMTRISRLRRLWLRMARKFKEFFWSHLKKTPRIQN